MKIKKSELKSIIIEEIEKLQEELASQGSLKQLSEQPYNPSAAGSNLRPPVRGGQDPTPFAKPYSPAKLKALAKKSAADKAARIKSKADRDARYKAGQDKKQREFAALSPSQQAMVKNYGSLAKISTGAATYARQVAIAFTGEQLQDDFYKAAFGFLKPLTNLNRFLAREGAMKLPEPYKFTAIDALNSLGQYVDKWVQEASKMTRQQIEAKKNEAKQRVGVLARDLSDAADSLSSSQALSEAKKYADAMEAAFSKMNK